MVGEFELFVSKEDFKFSCAHFIVHRGVRERLHGHNYQLSLRVVGDQGLCADGYLMDFGDVKRTARALCKELNERFLCPMKSAYMRIVEEGGNLCLQCVDGSRFSFPRQDCALLPLYHSSVEEMAHYLWCTLIERIGIEELRAKGVTLLEVGVQETANQLANYRRAIPRSVEELEAAKNTPLRVPPQSCFAEKD